MVVAGLYLFVDCTGLCALCRRLDTTHKGLLLPVPCLYASVNEHRMKTKNIINVIGSLKVVQK